MHPYQVSALGLLFDIVGAFFLSAEAIKIKNLRIMRDKVLARLRHAAVSPPFALGDDEELTPERQRQYQEAFQFGPPWGAKHPHLFTLLHYFAGVLICLAANWLLRDRLVEWFYNAATWMLASMPTVVAWLVLGFLGLWGIVGGLWMLGEIVHLLIIRVIRFSIEIIEFIDRRTADGGVGIVGFSLLVVGFLLQFFGTIAAGRI